MSRLHLDKIQTHLEAGYPNEACGILVGDISFSSSGQAAKAVRDVVLVANAWDDDVVEVFDLRGKPPQDNVEATQRGRPRGRRSPSASQNESRRNRYLISPEDIARADREAGKRGWDIIGFFHSHPDHPSQPSETDREWAWPVISFVITSVRDGKATTTQSWVLRDDREAFEEEPFVIDHDQ